MRRTVWLAAGFGLGLYAGQRLRRTVARCTPEHVGERLREVAADALDAGRAEMRARERALREMFAAPDRTTRRRAPGSGADRITGPGR